MLEKEQCKTISIMIIITTTKGEYFFHTILLMIYQFPKPKLDSTVGLGNNNASVMITCIVQISRCCQQMGARQARDERGTSLSQGGEKKELAVSGVTDGPRLWAVPGCLSAENPCSWSFHFHSSSLSLVGICTRSGIRPPMGMLKNGSLS